MTHHVVDVLEVRRTRPRPASRGASVDPGAHPQPRAPSAMRRRRDRPRPRGGTLTDVEYPPRRARRGSPSGASTMQVRVEGPIGVGAQRGDHHRTDRERRDEVSIHDVDMDEVGMLAHELDLLGQTGEVGRQDGRAQLGHGAHPSRERVARPRNAATNMSVAPVTMRPEAVTGGAAVGAVGLDRVPGRAGGATARHRPHPSRPG